MHRTSASVALLAFATPVLAGSAPGFVSSWETYTRAFARAGTPGNPHQVVEDIDDFSSFFGSTASAAFAQRLDGTVPVDLAQADSSLAVSGAGGSWVFDATLAASGFGFESEARSTAQFSFGATFDLGAGESLQYGGEIMQMYTSDKPGINFVRAMIFRDDVRIGNFVYDEVSDPFQQMVEEATGATYRLEFFGEARGGGSGAGGGSIPSANVTLDTHIEVSIIPAPAGFAPLALGGLLAARRRRRV